MRRSGKQWNGKALQPIRSAIRAGTITSAVQRFCVCKLGSLFLQIPSTHFVKSLIALYRILPNLFQTNKSRESVYCSPAFIMPVSALMGGQLQCSGSFQRVRLCPLWRSCSGFTAGSRTRRASASALKYAG